MAEDSPKSFIEHGAETLAIDEIQKCHRLLPAIKMDVDIDNRWGRYLLTGSANVFDLPQVKESLAGRVAEVRLHSLTQGEQMKRPPLFLERAFRREFPAEVQGGTKTELCVRACRGGYPEVLRLSAEERRRWYKDYLNSIIEHDCRDIADVRREGALQQLNIMLAARSSKFVDISDIASALELHRSTVETYINLMRLLYIFEPLPAWCKTDYKRCIFRPKWFASDPGLLPALLDWDEQELRLMPDESGKLMETFVYHELVALCNLRPEYHLYHFRSSNGPEIDFIVENSATGQMLAIEVKSGEATPSDFRHIRWFRDNLFKGKEFTGMVLHAGDQTYKLEEGLYLVPIPALWQKK